MLQDFSTDIEVPETPVFGSLESDIFRGTSAHNPPAPALLKGFEKSREQLLWKRWSSGSPFAASLYTNGADTPDLSSSSGDIFSPHRSQSTAEQPAGSAATSPCDRTKGRSRSVDADNQEIQLWTDQGYSKPKEDESPFSLHSEEGINSFSELDSDEEDAYSYILDLNKEVFLTYNLKHQVPRLKRETEKEINEESFEMVNGSGCKPQERSFAQNADLDVKSEVRAESVVQRKLVLDRKESSFRETTNNKAVFDMEPDDENSGKEEPEEQRVVRGQSDADYGEEEQTENGRLVTHEYDETDEGEKTKTFQRQSWQKEAEEEIGLSLKCSQVNETMTAGDKEETIITYDEEVEGKLEEEKEENVKEEDMQSVVSLEDSGRGGIMIDEPVCEVRDNSTTRINTEEETDGKGDVCGIEDVTKNSRDENKEESTNKVMNSKDLEAVIRVEEKNEGLKTNKRKLTSKEEETVNHHGERTDVNKRHSYNSCVCSLTPHSFR